MGNIGWIPDATVAVLRILSIHRLYTDVTRWYLELRQLIASGTFTTRTVLDRLAKHVNTPGVAPGMTCLRGSGQRCAR